MKHSELTDEVQEKASIYAAGAMPESERREFVRHMEEDDCAICRAEVREFEAAANVLALGPPSVDPSPSVKTRLLRQAEAAASSSGRAAAVRRRWPVWTAGLIAVAASILLIVTLQNNVTLRRLANSLGERVAALETQLNEQRLLVATLTS